MFVTSQKRLPLQQITSKGCSRGYILCVLYRALDYVRQVRKLKTKAPSCRLRSMRSVTVVPMIMCYDLKFLLLNQIYFSQRHASGQTVQFPFCHSDIKKWLEVKQYLHSFELDIWGIADIHTVHQLLPQAAQTDCSICENSYQEGLGGTPYDDRDPSTYWTQPQQFCTWYNITS